MQKAIDQAMQKVMEHFQGQLHTLRTGRANPAMLDGVTVELYGSNMKLREVATVSVPESRQLLVTPFDPKSIQAIAVGIEKSPVDLQPRVESGVIRIAIPSLDQARRQQMVKLGKGYVEQAKISVRAIRKEWNEKVRSEKGAGHVTEDEMKKMEKWIQERTDHFCVKIDQVFAEKEKEILTL